MRTMTRALTASAAALLLVGTLSTGTAHAATGTFSYHLPDGWHDKVNPPSDQCIALGVAMGGDADMAQNRTDHKALLYAGRTCDEGGLITGLSPGQPWFGGLRTAAAVRFEFA